MRVEIYKASLICGGTRFSEETKVVNSVPVSVPVSQVITARAEPGMTVSIDLRQVKIPYPFELGSAKGLASVVSGWQCKKTPTGHVLVLYYYCPQDLREDVPAALCSFTREWLRYVALNGSLLDRGFSFDDIRYDALRAKLGYHDKPPDQATDDDGHFIDFFR
ncbi:hypothetical protein [Lichenicoccus sp.]|uniref:hypothetical protein n=1 Tax=Lichenicoccus sp. TaxID=2781899 RepID=UPI003D118816